MRYPASFKICLALWGLTIRSYFYGSTCTRSYNGHLPFRSTSPSFLRIVEAAEMNMVQDGDGRRPDDQIGPSVVRLQTPDRPATIPDRPFVHKFTTHNFTTSQPLCLAFVNLSDEDDECNGELTRPGIERYMWLNVARCWYKGNLITSEAPDWAKHHCQASPRWGHTINHHQLTYFEFTWDEAIIITWSKKTILRVISLQMYPRWYGTSFCTVSFSNGSHAVVGQEQEDERSLMINAFMELPSEEMLQIARSFKWGWFCGFNEASLLDFVWWSSYSWYASRRASVQLC